jgi:hypothetical protein
MAAVTDHHSILEPSAGEGRILDVLTQEYSFQNLTIDAVELNKEKYLTLLSKGYNAYNQDFLQFTPDKLYDRIIACPPFKGNIDVVHIQKMFKHLDRKGILVTLTSPNWVNNNDAHQVEFRNWLSTKEYYARMLPDNSFMEKGRSVPTMILKIFNK